MINEENLNKLYSGVINGNELTTKELNGYGFNSKDLSTLIEQGNLERVKRGYYSFKSINDLFFYGKKLIAEKEYEKATECFKKCYELDPNHSGACFQLFLRSINKKDYETAFQYFEVLSKTDNPYYSADSNFFLYLLSIITDIPDKHKEYARYLKMEDIRVDFNDKRYKDIPQQNKIRLAVLQRKFPYALKQLKDLTIQHGSSTVQDIITRTLLFQAVESETISKKTLIELAKNKSYEEIVEHLEEKEKRHKLSLTDNYTLKLVNELINIQETKEIPKKTIFQAEKLFEAIDGNNYELALGLSENYNSKNNINNSESIINLLLLDICNLIKQYSSTVQKSSDIIEDESLETEEEVVKEEQIILSNNLSTNASFSNVISYLMKPDLEKAFRTLRNYMESINKKDYEFLIVDLIKLSLIEKDIAFTKPMIALTYISRENFRFDISNYIQEFYVTLSQNRFEEARIYLDIISKSNNLGQDCILTENLLQVLDKAEKMIDYKRNNTILENAEKAFEKSKSLDISKTNPIIASIEQSKPNMEIKSPQKIETKKTGSYPSVIKQKETNQLPLETRDSGKKFIENKHQLLLNGQGMILLRPMNDESRKRVHEMVKEYPDIVSFSIGEGENKQIVLRYKPFIEEYVDVKNLIKKGNLAYKEGNYDDCIKNYLQLLQFREPKAFVYAKLGLAYLKKGNKKTAIDYFRVATQLSKKEKGEFDFTELVADLSGLIDRKDKKPRFRMSTEDFENDIENHYGIENLDEITSYILECGLDVESACKELGMTDEQIDIVRLIYAREFYSQGNYEKGEQFLNSVEKSKNKTKFTLKLFEEIRRNKRFYINRTNENPQKLVLTLKPRKTK